MGKYQVEAALKVAVASEATESVNSLGNLIKQQNQAQIDQNKLIAKVLKEVTEARKHDKTEIVQVERKQRDVTAGMNDYTAAIVKAKGAIYDTTGVVRNLGESIAKGLTFWAPWLGWINMAIDAFKWLSNQLETTNAWTNALYASMDRLSNVKPPDMSKFASGVQALNNAMLSYSEGVKKFGPFVSWEEFSQPDPGIQKNQIVGWLENLAKNAVTAQKMLPDLKRQLAENTISMKGVDEELEKYLKEQKQAEDLYNLSNERFTEIRKGARWVIDPVEQLYGFIYDRFVRPELEERITEAMTNANNKLADKKKLMDVRRNLAQEILQAEIDSSDYVEDIYKELQFELAQIPEEDGSGKGKGKGKGGAGSGDYIKKNLYPNLDYFWENWYAADGEIRKTWLEKLQEQREKDLRKADEIFLKSPAAGAVAKALVEDTYRKNREKGLAEAWDRFHELNDVWEQEIRRAEGLKDQQAKALDMGSLKYRTYDRFSPDLSNLDPKKKKELADYAAKLADTLNKDVEKAWGERNSALDRINKEIEQLREMDLTGLGPSDREKILERVRSLEEEKLKIRQEYFDKRRQAEEKHEQGLEELHVKEVTAFGDQFRIIDKESEAWKKSDEAMNTMVTAIDTLGFSEKKVFALQNYAKGIEASVDAINCQADAIIKFGLGDIKGGIALQAAAVAKGIAAYSYFKNSMEMGGKGGSAPSVGTAAVTGTDVKERDITINMAFEGTAGAIIRPLADAFNQQATVPGGVRLNSRLVRA